MPESQIRDFASGKGFRPQTLARWLKWSPPDRDALWVLAAGLKISENHLRDLMDWLEEVALRDQCEIHDILGGNAVKDLASDPRLGRADKLKRIKEQIRRVRFPRLSQIEESIRERIQELKLQPEIYLTVPPGLEGGRLYVEFSASTPDELRRLSAKLAAAADTDAIKATFALLVGSIGKGEHKPKE